VVAARPARALLDKPFGNRSIHAGVQFMPDQAGQAFAAWGLMPLAKCPKCNRAFHIDSVDPDSWYAKRWPQLQSADFVPDLCWVCRREHRLIRRGNLENDCQDRKVS
jgi:hypothetical protein